MGRAVVVVAIGAVGISCAAIFVRFALPAPPVVTGLYRMAFALSLMAGFAALRRPQLSSYRPGAAAAGARGYRAGRAG